MVAKRTRIYSLRIFSRRLGENLKEEGAGDFCDGLDFPD